jgi:valyl-tRNA synthetase
MLENKYNHLINEEKWMRRWKEDKTYKFKLDGRKIFSIDTPPPTVSGKIHIGHIFSYSQTEMVARYKRLRDYNVFYPFGFDDNGLPSERLVEKEIGKKASEIGREEFNKLCIETTNRYEEEFKVLFSKMGVSTDWDLAYKTVSPETIKISQASFLDLVQKNHAYHKESPALWCNECLTSIAQAELETKRVETNFNYINFKAENKEFTIATTRPELLPAIVAVFVNPNDPQNKDLIGQEATIPLINIKVPILGDEKVDPDKGTGIVMCCTFGDQTDIEWWKKYNLPLKNILTNEGFLNSNAGQYEGLRIKQARKKIVEDLQELGYLVKVEPLEHDVQVHERCGKEIEYTIIKQWFIDLISNKEAFLKKGEEINWYPEHMSKRYKEWVENVMWDWCISRQRYFGVPFPVWYCEDCHKPHFAEVEDLPVNPLVDKPKTSCSCGSNNFIPEKDVMDTWATSSVTPLINMRYGTENNYEKELRPMSLRTNASEIIRTWDFYTIVKSFYHFNEKPWENVMISGFVMADKGEKISKSKENSKQEPFELINNYSADVIRYWAASGRLGTDIVFSEETLLRGKKLLNKLWNVSKFIEMHLTDYDKNTKVKDLEYFDRWILSKYSEMENQYLSYMDDYEVGLALNVLEKFFWNFCDNYIEIVKHRLYRPEEFDAEKRLSGQYTVYTILFKLLQKMSIFFPFMTEEISRELYDSNVSIHNTKISSVDVKDDLTIKNGDILNEIIGSVRGEKSSNNTSLKTVVSFIEIDANKNVIDAFNASILDLKATLFLKMIILNEDNEINFKIKKIDLDIDK